jgi:hypothetical protein
MSTSIAFPDDEGILAELLADLDAAADFEELLWLEAHSWPAPAGIESVTAGASTFLQGQESRDTSW